MFSLFFPCLTANFPCANLRDLWLLHTPNWLGRHIQLKKLGGNFCGKYRNIFYLRNQGIYNLSNPNFLCFPCVLAKFPNSLCFSWQGIFITILPVFPVQWVPWLYKRMINDKIISITKVNQSTLTCEYKRCRPFRIWYVVSCCRSQLSNPTVKISMYVDAIKCVLCHQLFWQETQFSSFSLQFYCQETKSTPFNYSNVQSWLYCYIVENNPL